MRRTLIFATVFVTFTIFMIYLWQQPGGTTNSQAGLTLPATNQPTLVAPHAPESRMHGGEAGEPASHPTPATISALPVPLPKLPRPAELMGKTSEDVYAQLGKPDLIERPMIFMFANYPDLPAGSLMDYAGHMDWGYGWRQPGSVVTDTRLSQNQYVMLRLTNQKPLRVWVLAYNFPYEDLQGGLTPPYTLRQFMRPGQLPSQLPEMVISTAPSGSWYFLSAKPFTQDTAADWAVDLSLALPATRVTTKFNPAAGKDEITVDFTNWQDFRVVRYLEIDGSLVKNEQ